MPPAQVVAIVIFIITSVFTAGMFVGITKYALPKLTELMAQLRQDFQTAVIEIKQEASKQVEKMEEVRETVAAHTVEIDHLKKTRPGFKTGNSR